MPSFMRFYLVATEFDVNSWFSISELLKIISLNKVLAGSQIPPTLKLFYQSLELDANDTKQLEYSKFGHELRRNDTIDIKFLTKASLLKDFVVIIRLRDGYYNFKDYLPFFLLYEEYENISLGIDLNQLTNKRHINEIKYSLGQLLWRWRAKDRKYIYKDVSYVIADHLFYYIYEDYYKKGVSQKQIHRGKFPADDKGVLRKFSPFIEINPKTFEDIFLKTSSSHSLFHFSNSKFILNKSEYKDIKITHEEELIYSNLLMLMAMDFLSTDQFNKDLSRVIYEQLADEPIFTIYLFCMFLLRIIKTYKTKELKHSILGETSLKGYLYLIRSYSNGIREIIENIVDHTDSQHGYLYVVLRETNEIEKIFGLQNTSANQNQLLQGSLLKKYLRNISEECEYILEIYAIDSNNMGIVDSYKEEYFKVHKRKDPTDVTLLNFFDNNYFDFPETSRLEWRYLAHLGLKTFAKLNSENNGYLFVETNHDKSKKGMIAFSEIENGSRQYKYVNEKIDIVSFSGSFYTIILPITKNVTLVESAPILYEIDSNEKFYEEYLKKNYDFHEIKYTDFSRIISKNKIEEVVEIGDRIVNLLHKHTSGKVLINYSDVKKSESSINRLIKILAYVQLKKKVPHIILFNIPEYEITQIKKSLEAITSSRTFWHHDFWLMLYDENGKPLIINGRHPSVCYNLNNYLSAFYGETYNIEYDAHNRNVPRNTQSSFFHPFEILLKTDYDNRIPITLFEHYLFRILNRVIDENENQDNNYDIGFKLEQAHMKLGSKLHINNFYYAEHLFNNSFYAYRFAFLLSKEIILRINVMSKSRILLVGYGGYSEMLVNKIMRLLELNKELKSKLLDYYLICKDVDKLQFQNIDQFKETLTSESSSNYVPIENIDYVVIVPIGSTLTTNSKIVNSLEQNIKSILKNDHKIVEDRILLNATLLLVRDGNNDDKAFKEISDFEKEYGWTHLDSVNRNIKTKQFDLKGVNFFIPLLGNWLSPLLCKKCFPEVDGNVEQTSAFLLQEEALFETNKISVLPINILGYPRVNHAVLEKEKINRKRIEKFNGLIKYPHIERGKKHYLYYMDTEKYCKISENIRDIEAWLSTIKHLVLNNKNNYLDVIVTVLHDSNIGFINLVNFTIFDGAALVIRLDLEQDFRDNIIIKYGFLNKIAQGIRVHFVDDTISTGHNVNGAKSFVNSIFYNFKEEVVIYSSIIVLLNRSSLYRQDDVTQIRKMSKDYSIPNSQFFAYMNLYVPPLKDTGTSCFVCESEKSKKILSKNSILDLMKTYFHEGSVKIKTRDYVNNLEYNNKTQYFKRMMIIHDLYYLYSSTQTEKQHILGDYEKLLKTVEERINFIKVISYPLFSYYKNIRKDAFSIILANLNNLLNIVETNAKPSLVDINYLFVLIKQSAELNSNFIIRKYNIIRIWKYYARYLEVFDCFINLQKNDELMELINSEYMLSKSSMLQNITETLKDKLKQKFSLSEIRVILGILQKFDKRSLTIIYSNILKFSMKYAQSIKSLVDNDEPRSFWFEYLIRSGNELSSSAQPNPENSEELFPSSIPSFDPSNEIYLLGNKIFDKESLLREKYREFFNIVFYENNSILRIGIVRLMEELKSSEFIRLEEIDVKTIITIHDKITGKLKEHIISRYYYDSLAKYLADDELCVLESILALKVYFNSIVEGKVKVNDVDQTLSQVVKYLSQNVFHSDIAWFEIKNYPIDKRTFAIGIDGIESYLDKPFEINDAYYSYEKFHDKHNSWYNVFSDYEIIPAEYYESNHYSIKHALVFRFFTQKSIYDSGTPEAFAGLVFYYKREFNIDDWKKEKRLIKLFLNLKSDIENFMENNFANVNLNSWIQGKESDILIHRRYESFTHNLGSECRALVQSIDFNSNNNPQPDYPTLYKNAIAVRSRIYIGHYFSLLMKDKNIDIKPESPNKLSSIFHGSTNYLLMLEHLINYEYNDIKLDFNVDENLVTDLVIADLQDFITEFVMNYLKAAETSNKIKKILIMTSEYEDVNENSLVIETSGCEISITQEQINNILASDTQLGSSIGLFTINKYFKLVQKTKLDIIIDKTSESFIIIMPLRRKYDAY